MCGVDAAAHSDRFTHTFQAILPYNLASSNSAVDKILLV
jgi:hypothetical protein